MLLLYKADANLGYHGLPNSCGRVESCIMYEDGNCKPGSAAFRLGWSLVGVRATYKFRTLQALTTILRRRVQRVRVDYT